MGKVYEEVMLSNPLEDEEPFRTIVNGAIDEGEVEAYDAFVKESKRSKDARMRKARKEAGDAEKEAKTNKRYQSIFGGDGKGGRDATSGSGPEDGDTHGDGAGVEKKKKGDTSDLAAMIQLRQAARSDDFLGRLEAKYAGDAAKKTTSRGKKRKAVDEPNDEAFERTKAKMAKAKAGEADVKPNGKKPAKGARRSTRPVADEADTEEEEEEDEDIDLENGTDGDEEEEEEEEEDLGYDVAEEESEGEADAEVRPRRKAQKGKTSSKKAPPAPPPPPPPPPPAAKKKKRTAPATATTRGRARGKK